MRAPHREVTRRPAGSAPLLRSAAVALLLIATAACSAVRPSAAPIAPLRVGTSGDYPPFSLRTGDGGWDGFDVAVARAYAADRGRTLELVAFRWPELGTRLAAGDFDVAMSGVTVRGDRLLVGTMTAAVARADAVLLVRREERRRDGFDRPSARIAVNRGGHLERVARARLPHATLVTVDDNHALPVLLRERTVDAVVTDTLEAATYEPGAFRIATRLARDRKAYWTAPGRSDLAADLDAWLLVRERDGTLPRLRAERLRGADPAALPPEIARVADYAGRRLLLMPLVAAAKRAAGLPLVDPAREAEVVARAAARAAAAGLDADAAAALARAQIAAARAVQEAVPAPAPSGAIGAPASGASAAPTNGSNPPPALAALRTAIDALDGTLLQAILTARAAAATADRTVVTDALRGDADLPGFDDTHAGAIAAALVALLETDR